MKWRRSMTHMSTPVWRRWRRTQGGLALILAVALLLAPASPARAPVTTRLARSGGKATLHSAAPP